MQQSTNQLNLEKMPAKDIIEKIKQTKREIKKQKTKMEHPYFFMEDCDIQDREKAKLDLLRKQLREMKEHIYKQGYPYSLYKEPKREIAFNSKIPYIKELTLAASITCIDSGTTVVGYKIATCTVKEDEVHIFISYKDMDPPVDYNPSIKIIKKTDFLQALKDLYMCEWRKVYDDMHIYGIDSGGVNMWYCDIKYKSGIRPLHYKGNGCAPYNIDDFFYLTQIYAL